MSYKGESVKIRKLLVLDVAYNTEEYLIIRREGKVIPLAKTILLILGNFPLFIDFLMPKKLPKNLTKTVRLV